MSKTISFSIQELPQGGFVMMDGKGHPVRAFSTLDETMGRVVADLRNEFAGADPATVAKRFAPRQTMELPDVPMPEIEKRRGVIGRMVGRA